MDERIKDELNSAVLAWFAQRGLLRENETVKVTVQIVPARPLELEVLESAAKNEDEEVLKRALKRLPENFQRRFNFNFEHHDITRLSQFKDESYSRVIGAGKKGHFKLAEALKAEGAPDCEYIRSALEPSRPTKFMQELERLAFRKLTRQEWQEIFKFPWDKEDLKALQRIRARNNHKVPMSNLPTKHHGAVALTSFNYSFRRFRLPFRMKIVEVPEFGGERLIQIGVLPKSDDQESAAIQPDDDPRLLDQTGP